MSRRLDISALLCNDDDEQPPQRSARPTSSSSPILARRPPQPPPPPSFSQGGFVGFDALVHAATEERRRLSGGDLAQHHIQYQQPPQHHHQQPPPPRLSPQFHRSPWQEEQQYAPPPQSPRHSNPRDSPIDAYKSPPPRHTHPFDERSSHQMRQFQIMEDQKRKQEMDIVRTQELERRRQQELERARLQELERTKAERQELDRARRELEEERRRIEDMKQQLEAEKAQTAELARRREEEEREERRRREADRQRLEDERRRDHEREVAVRRDAERHQQRREVEMHMQRRQEEQLQQQRMYDMQRAADIDRQRRQAIQLQQQQQQQYFHHQQQPQAPQQHRNYEHPPRIEIPPGPQHHVRKTDPSPPSKTESQSPSIPHAHPDQRPAKRPRYSDSPSLAPMVIDDKDRIARERERMTVGEIGYGRVESPVAPPPSSSSSTPSVPRRPGSGTGVRRPVSVSDLLSPEPQPPLPTPVDSHHPPLRIISRDKEPVTNAHHHHHRILSPLGRRSPPGSQAGRAKAARKSEEHAHPVAPSVSASSTSSTSFTPTMTTSHAPPPPPSSTTLPSRKSVVKEEHVKRQKIEDSPSPMLMEPKRISPSTMHARESPTASHPTPAPPAPPRLSKEHLHNPSQQQGDADDWFLEQIDQASPPAKKDRHAPHRHTRSPSVPSQHRTASPVVQVKKQSPSPVVRDNDVDTALEQELEELLAEVEEEVETAPKEESMDVDSVVAELVETLEGDDDGEEEVTTKPTVRDHTIEEECMPLAADVDDELLSLIDDKPPAPVSSTSARRASGSSTSVTASLAPPTARIVKQAPPSLKTAGAPSTGTASPIPSLMGPGVRPEPSKPRSERGSMPPPPIVGKKEKDHEGKRQEVGEALGVSATMTAVPKKKKDATGTKKAKAKATVTEKGAISTTIDGSQDAQPKPRPKVTKSKKASTSTIPTKADSTVPALATTASNTASSSKAPAATKPANAATAGSRKHASVSSRSRSTSTMPGAFEEDVPTRASSVAQDKSKAEKQEEEEESDAANEDDRLYCVCKTKYDQERCMIACDRCDEWYHMQCLDMPENLADLVDQFFCPPCIEKNPLLNLRTTYKQRCLWGLKCPDPTSPRACHKPARGAFSKYCSDECGVKYMQSRIDTWAKKGGKKEKLWDSVKSADKREGVVVRIDEDDASGCNGNPPKDGLKDGQLKPSKPAKSKGERERERLNKVLQEIAHAANELKKGMEVLALREKVLEMAGERAESVGQCGWDQRLCYGDEEWMENGQSALESYEDRDMDVDGQSDSVEGDWWCAEDAGCSRHMGWQTTRFKDICKEKEKREEALQNLNARDSAVRKQLEELVDPPLKKHGATATAGGTNSTHREKNGVVAAKGAARHGPLASTNTKMANGHGQKSRAAAGDALKKGKKRKAPSS